MFILALILSLNLFQLFLFIFFLDYFFIHIVLSTSGIIWKETKLRKIKIVIRQQVTLYFEYRTGRIFGVHASIFSELIVSTLTLFHVHSWLVQTVLVPWCSDLFLLRFWQEYHDAMNCPTDMSSLVDV